MLWIFVIIIVGYILINFFLSLNKDNYDLEHMNLSEKFKIIVFNLNKSAYNGDGTITYLEKRSFNLYKEGSNQIINFHYSTGHLTITWKYKYFQKEIKHSKQFDDVRNISIFDQQKIAEIIINEMNIIINQHKNDVLNGGKYY